MVGFARGTVKRGVLTMITAQAVVIVGVVAVDVYQRSRRTKRPGFPQPGTFHTTIAGTETTVFTYGEDLFDAMIAAIDDAARSLSSI